MVAITVEVKIASPIKLVWEVIADIQSHTNWMADAETIRITSETTEGIGTSFDCNTKIGPLRTTDRMVITKWEPESTMGVRHEGLVTGEGFFTLISKSTDETIFAWKEHLIFPWWLGGPITGFISKPILQSLWKKNLERLKIQIESFSHN
tara:strand:+ start:148 stop:597 length:450 start_codon:yes stop_codon:yes gene_type:complete